MASPESSAQKFYSFTDIPHEVAYHLEGQAIAVQQAQEINRLRVSFSDFGGASVVKELGHKWVVLNEGAKLFAGDCDMDLVWQLNESEKSICYTSITGDFLRPDVFDGRYEYPVAAILVDNRILYRSPGFDLESWMASPHPNIDPKPEKQRMKKALTEFRRTPLAGR